MKCADESEYKNNQEMTYNFRKYTVIVYGPINDRKPKGLLFNDSFFTTIPSIASSYDRRIYDKEECQQLNLKC